MIQRCVLHQEVSTGTEMFLLHLELFEYFFNKKSKCRKIHFYSNSGVYLTLPSSSPVVYNTPQSIDSAVLDTPRSCIVLHKQNKLSSVSSTAECWLHQVKYTKELIASALKATILQKTDCWFTSLSNILHWESISYSNISMKIWPNLKWSQGTSNRTRRSYLMKNQHSKILEHCPF